MIEEKYIEQAKVLIRLIKAGGGVGDGSGNEANPGDGDLGCVGVVNGDQPVTVKDFPVPFKLDLPDELNARRFRIKDKDGVNIYTTICDVDDSPVEMFIKHPYEKPNSYLNAISRLVSLAMRYNIPLKDICKQLGKSSTSVVDMPARLARILDKYQTTEETTEVCKDPCPDCGASVTPGGGCFSCTSCGWSKCH